MFTKTVFVLCAQALLIQSAFSQCVSMPTCGCNGLGYSNVAVNNLCGINGASGLSLANMAGSLSASNGGGFTVSSGSPYSPSGLSMISDNVIDGNLMVNGQSAFVSAVGLGGNLPTSGSASANYASGNSNQVGILSESANGLGYGGVGVIGNGYFGNGIGLANIGGVGCGYNGLGYNGLGYNGLGYNGYTCGCGC